MEGLGLRCSSLDTLTHCVDALLSPSLQIFPLPQLSGFKYFSLVGPTMLYQFLYLTLLFSNSCSPFSILFDFFYSSLRRKPCLVFSISSNLCLRGCTFRGFSNLLSFLCISFSSCLYFFLAFFSVLSAFICSLQLASFANFDCYSQLFDLEAAAPKHFQICNFFLVKTDVTFSPGPQLSLTEPCLSPFPNFQNTLIGSLVQTCSEFA